ncbi:protein kinase [Kitasatospora sp. NPDC090091]|uniref:protein kinase domain-containing protein n=1 Tax=Kitasatospora sp. NPDC090091 TaxID=3364081 RepID=UPI003802DF54
MNVAGTQIAGRYRLEVPLGRGGMGEVWRAYDPRLERQVAIKFLSRQSAPGRAHLDRFQREARVTARLQHPGITQVFDSGAHDGQLYLVMELLHGRDLATVLRHRTVLPVEQVVDLTAQVADALAYAHQADIVHRDVKPANLMLVDGGRVKICDFGLAGFVRADSGLTRTGDIMGTPDYMAPEQWRGLRVDGRADLYALGCVLFALLTGRAPFTAGHGGYAAVMMHHILTPAPSAAGLRREVPHALDRLVMQLLAKDPADRPADAAAVSDALRSLGSEPVGPVPPAWPATPPAPRARPDGAATTDAEPALRLTSFYDDHLPSGATEAQALIEVIGTGAGANGTAAAPPRALVFLLGLSEELPEADLRAVRQAVAEAVDGLDDNASFAIVAGSEYARMLYPETLRLAPASAAAKAGARAALERLEPIRDAAFGRWIRLADQLFSAHSAAVRTAVMLIDLVAEAETPDALAAALASCTGRFTCHARGLGTNWEVAQLRSVSEALGGTVNIVEAPASPTSGIEQELARIVGRTRQSVARDLALRITAPAGGRVRFLKQVTPELVDLTARAHPVGPGTTEYAVAAPDNETRDYHLCLDLPPGRHGDQIAAVAEIVLLPPAGDGQVLARLELPYRLGELGTGPGGEHRL